MRDNDYVREFENFVESRWNDRWHSIDKAGQLVGAYFPVPIVAALGLAGECGEVVELLKKHIRDGKHPGEKILLELGDVLHYLTVIARCYGYTLGDLMQANEEKLTERDRQRGVVAP